MKEQKLSRKEWRKNAKKIQRKRRRRSVAIKQNEEQKKREQSPTYQTKLAEEHALELIELQNIERMNDIEHEKWILSELRIEREWQIRKRKLEEQNRKKEAERQRIQEEFEAEQKRIAQAKEEKQRLIEEERMRQMDLKIRIRAYIEGMDDSIPPELLVEAESNPGKELCQYFIKTGSCRFGNKCLRNHKRPKISKTLMIESFFTNIHLEQNEPTEYGNDMILECEDSDIYGEFKEFFTDVVPEFEIFGCIKFFAVCMNYEPHIRGNVFIEYTSERDALRAQQIMNGRYYASRMLNIEFRTILWRSAICGRSRSQFDITFGSFLHSIYTIGELPEKFVAQSLFKIGLSLKNVCSKGKNCNYFHMFKNPENRYVIDKAALEEVKNEQTGTVRNEEKDNWNFSDEQNQRNWRWSESPIREVIGKNACKIENEHNRKVINGSRSPSHRKSRKRSRSRSTSRSKKNRRSHSRSKQRTKSSKHKSNRHGH